MPTLIPVHVAAGGLAIVFGTIALLVRKGGWTHRRIGLAFVYAMLVMGISGSVMAFHRSMTDANVMGGFMSAYFVVTGLTAVRPASTATRWLNAGALVVGVVLSAVQFTLGVIAFRTPRGLLDGVPYFMLFFLGAVVAMAAASDVRLMRSGPLRGVPRLSRHLWRMCFALFIAAGSFFSIRARVAMILPDVFAASMFRMLPIPAVFAAMFYWLWRIRGRTIPQRN